MLLATALPAQEGHPLAVSSGHYPPQGYVWENNDLGLADVVPEPCGHPSRSRLGGCACGDATTYWATDPSRGRSPLRASTCSRSHRDWR